MQYKYGTAAQLIKLGRKMEREVRRMDPKLNPADPAFLAAVVLLLSAIVGPNVRKIATAAGVHQGVVREMGQRLRRSGIWTRTKVAARDWVDPQTGGVSFWLAAGAALGHVTQVTGVTAGGEA